VSKEKIDGGRFIDTTGLPKLGYIATKPDLVVTRLEAVTLDTEVAHDDVMIDKDGKRTVVPRKAQAAVSITFCPNDRKRFASLSERAVGMRLLLMLGDTPLTAPYVMTPIDSPSVTLTFDAETDRKKVTGELKKLVQ
jgi:hypothetical protein